MSGTDAFHDAISDEGALGEHKESKPEGETVLEEKDAKGPNFEQRLQQLIDEIKAVDAEMKRPAPKGTTQNWRRRNELHMKLQNLKQQKEYFECHRTLTRYCELKGSLVEFTRNPNELWTALDTLQRLEQQRSGGIYSLSDPPPAFVTDVMKMLIWQMVPEVTAPGAPPINNTEDVVSVLSLTGNVVCAFDFDPGMTIRDIKMQIAEIQGTLCLQRDQACDFHLLSNVSSGEPLANELTLGEIDDMGPGGELLLTLKEYCEMCVGECQCETCHHGQTGRYGPTSSYFRPTVDKDYKACTVCGYCKYCRGKCKCTTCHGNGSSRRGGCPECKVYYDPCWGGASRALLPDGSTKFIRDVRVGDTLRTVKGVRRVAAIWSGPHIRGRTEVCNFQGVWITSHHPVIVGRRWVFPADVCTSYPLHEKQQEVGDLFNFELEGHDDTLLLKGETTENVIVTCTLGKYLGPRFGINVCTRRSTRCDGPCAQCDAVYVPGLDFGRIDPALRWRSFPQFPQVEWDGAEKTEFDFAADVLRANPASTWQASDTEPAAEPPWKHAILAGLEDRVSAKQHRITDEGLTQLLAAHKTCITAPPKVREEGERGADKLTKVEDFGQEAGLASPMPWQMGTCGICFGVGEVRRACGMCDGWCCRGCLLRHAKNVSSRYPYALPLLPCPWCEHRIPSATWSSLGAQLGTQKAAALLSASCRCCGQSNSAFVEQAEIVTESVARRRVASKCFADAECALKVWRQYHDAAIGPKEAFQRMLPALAVDAQDGGQQASIRKMLLMVVDEERRMGLQLASLLVNPDLCCAKCGHKVCLRCHRDAHQGNCPPQAPCSATCPSCGAGANLSSNHNMLLCICGKYWEHDEGATDAVAPQKALKWDVKQMRASSSQACPIAACT